MQVSLSSSTSRVAVRQSRGKAAFTTRSSSSSSSSGRARTVRVRAEAPEYDRDTGFVSEDNSGRSNIFPRKQQAYIKSSTSDAAAQQGLGGVQGGIVLAVVIGAVVAATLFTTKAPGPETLQTIGDGFQGESLAAIAQRIQSSL